MFFLIIFPFLNFQSQQGELDLLNKKTQEILREADPINRSNIEQENTQINKDWKDVVDSLENRVEALAGLAQHWEDFDKRIHAFESQLTRLDERNRNVDQVVRSRRHLEDTKNVVQVSVLGIPFGYHYYLLFFFWRKNNLITEKLWYEANEVIRVKIKTIVASAKKRNNTGYILYRYIFDAESHIIDIS